VRLGVGLRAAAERAAYRSGMCLSHWIKKVVEEAVVRSGEDAGHFQKFPDAVPNPVETELDSAFRQEMEKLNDR
jgi:hypothetical protein